MNPRVLYRAATYATDARAAADSVISALTPAAWYRNATNVVQSGGFASLWGDYAGTTKGLVLPGVAGNNASTPNSSAVDITGDIDLICRCYVDDVTPAGTQAMIGKFAAGSDNYMFVFTTDGKLGFWGTGDTDKRATVAASVTDRQIFWGRCTKNTTTGDINFYTAADSTTIPTSWTQLGTTVAGATGPRTAAPTESLYIGARNSGTTSIMSGGVLRAIVKDGIDGTTVFDADFSAQSFGASSFTESSSNAATVTVNASGAAPAHIGYARDLMQGVGTNQPAYSAGVLTFDGVDNWMRPNTFVMASPVTVVMVVKQVSWTNDDRIMDGFNVDTSIIRQTTASPQIGAWGGTTYSSNSSSLAVGSRGIVLRVWNGASSVLRVNNQAEITDGTGTIGTTGGVTIGARGGGGVADWANIALEEFVVFNSALDATNRSAVITALNNALTVF